MFETVQIARRHLMRYEHPDLESAMEASTSWSATVAGALSGWFVPSGQHNSERPESEEHEEAGNDSSSLLYFWPNHPY